MGDNEKNSVLIVDDERVNLDLLVKILSSEYTIFMTKNGSSAIEMANDLLPDIILLDIVMQDMSGYEVLEALKSSEKTRHIPVVFITGLESAEAEEKGLALQAADYILKPFSPAIVKLRVGNQIQIVNQIRAIKKYAHEVAASEERSKFFARMSHEMRTPLNAVIGLSEMTLEEGSLSDYACENIAKVCNAGTSLLHMVNDILDISKLEDGKFHLVPAEYSFPDMINDTIAQSVVIRGENPVVFLLTIDAKIPLHLFGDDQRIKQILNNLLSNAFKYTKEGTVELIVNRKTEDDNILLVFNVKDTGVGIPAESLGSIFSDYMRMETETNRNIAGTGLGLPITKMLVEMMSGEITVESEYGKGTCFTVKIPQQSVSSEVIGPEIVNSLKNFQYAAGKHKIKSRLARVSLPYAHILVVDDVVTNLDVAKGMMKPYRMNVDCATSGQTAVDAVRGEKVKYNAIFMDQMMPEMDGIEAVRIIREEIGTEYARTVPIVAFTANALNGNEDMFLSKGFNAFITKPLEINRLDSIIQKWVRNEEQEKLYKESAAANGEENIQDRRMGGCRRRGNDRRLFEDKIEGINVRKGLDRFNGDRETFMQVLQSFSINTRSLLDSMKEVNKDNLALYAINVHGVKSSCRGICAEEMGIRAETLEKAAKAGDLDFVTANNPLLIENVLKLTANIDAALNKGTEKAEKLKKDKPYNEALEKLRIACGDYKIEDVDAIIKEIEYFEYTADEGLVKWLRENVDQMNYMEIAEKLSGAAEYA